jgi:hypothetical protein
MAQPATTWNAEATDAKGYWVNTPESAERVDVDVDWSEIQHTAEASRDLPREVEARLPVAPLTEAALPAGFEEGSFEVPEFTLSEKKRGAEPALARWEVLDTLVDDVEEESPTEEVARPPATNVKVFARSKAFTEAISHDLPGRGSAGVSIEGPAPDPSISLDLEPLVVQPVEPVVVEAEPAPRVEAADLSVDAKRALARAMAAKAMANQKRAPSPGSLPPVGELVTPRPQVALPASTQESWSWDEADPLAAPVVPTPEPAPRRPSLSLVRAAPSVEDYDNTLATPLPAPPRPDVVVPWPLPQMRATIGHPLAAPRLELAPLDGMDSVSLDVVDLEGNEAPVAVEPAGPSALTWVVGGVALVGTLGLALVGSVSMVGVVVLVAVLG